MNALYGAAHTAEIAGDLAKAASLYEDLLALCPEGLSDHVHLAQARAFLANINLERISATQYAALRVSGAA